MSEEFPRVQITKLVEGGQGLGELPDGKKVFVWNALPGETVGIRLIKQKHSFAEAIAEQIIIASPDRAEPVRPYFLSTSPWQIMTFAAENIFKHEIVRDIFQHAKVPLPEFTITALAEGVAGADPEAQRGVYHYRSKIEYSFWGDDQGVHLAVHQRGSHGKQIVTVSSLAMPGMDEVGNILCAQLTKRKIRASDLKTIIIRSSQRSEIVASLFVKREDFPAVTLPPELKGLRVYFSNPQSPASVRTKLLQELGDVLLTDTLLGKSFVYDADSFFQINLPVYERALERIKTYANDETLVDMYAGVGTIGLSVATKAVELIELDSATARMAEQNARTSGLDASVIEASTEKVLDYIKADRPVIFDPPRAGLHDKVTGRVLAVQPPKVIYLSCNPATQARDLARLQDAYDIIHFEAFNFFPRTPHIETLAVLTARQQPSKAVKK